MASNKTPNDGETYIIQPPYSGDRHKSHTRIDTAPTEILSSPKVAGGSNASTTGPFVDPYATVIMPDAGKVAAGAGHTHVIRPDAPIGAKSAINPVVGLLIVVGGPGKGAFRPLFYGNNSIGRDRSQTVSLDFGDEAISGQDQCFIRYDHIVRAFLFIPNNAKTNPVSVNADRPTNTVNLCPGDELGVGQTRLRFIPVCGPQFDWADVKDQ